MTASQIRAKTARGLLLAATLSLLVSIFIAVPVQAGGLALSGTFYRQDFKMPQGSSLSSPDIYVVIFNNSNDGINIRMTGQAPPSVELILSDTDLQIKAGEQYKVLISLQVGLDAIPGEYEIAIPAEAYKESAGIQLLGAVGQTAKITITGEAASVEVIAVRPDGEPVPAVIRLCRQTESESFEVSYSETGSLKSKVIPGSYVTSAYVAGKKVAEESFDITANEEKKILLTVKTVYFEGFGIVSHYTKDTGKLAMVKIVYSVNNLYQSFPQAEVRLKVSYNSTSLEEAKLVNLSPLEKGKIELSYNYIPAEGWKEGIYGFKLELHISGEVYTATPEKELEGSGEYESPTTTGDGGAFNWKLAGGIAGWVVFLVIIIVLIRKKTGLLGS